MPFKHTGWTLIELVIMLLIISILGSILFAKFYGNESEVRQFSVDSVASGLNAASAGNYRLAKAGSAGAVSITNCTNVANLLTGGLPSGYQIISQTVAANTRVTCTVADTSNNATATFVATGV